MLNVPDLGEPKRQRQEDGGGWVSSAPYGHVRRHMKRAAGGTSFCVTQPRPRCCQRRCSCQSQWDAGVRTQLPSLKLCYLFLFQKSEPRITGPLWPQIDAALLSDTSACKANFKKFSRTVLAGNPPQGHCLSRPGPLLYPSLFVLEERDAQSFLGACPWQHAASLLPILGSSKQLNQSPLTFY